MSPPPLFRPDASPTEKAVLSVVVSIIFIGCLALWLAWSNNYINLDPQSRVTMESYNKLQLGMTYHEVVGILGKQGTEMSSNQFGNMRTVMYQWEGGSGGNAPSSPPLSLLQSIGSVFIL